MGSNRVITKFLLCLSLFHKVLKQPSKIQKLYQHKMKAEDKRPEGHEHEIIPELRIKQNSFSKISALANKLQTLAVTFLKSSIERETGSITQFSLLLA